MAIKLIALDLDGTLVDDRDISEENKETLKKVIRRGYPVVPATTRIRLSSERLLDGLGLHNYPLVCNNGARVLGSGWDRPEDIREHRNIRLDPDISKAIISRADERGHRFSIIFDEMVCRTMDEMERSDDPKIRIVDENSKALEYGEPINFMIHRSENDLEALKDLRKFVTENYEDKVRVDGHHRGGELLTLTIYDQAVNKASGLELVCDEMGISLKEVLAIGDDQVDIEMIEEAGTGIAMGNAPEFVKESADETAPRCRENGVSSVLKKHILR